MRSTASFSAEGSVEPSPKGLKSPTGSFHGPGILRSAKYSQRPLGSTKGNAGSFRKQPVRSDGKHPAPKQSVLSQAELQRTLAAYYSFEGEAVTLAHLPQLLRTLCVSIPHNFDLRQYTSRGEPSDIVQPDTFVMLVSDAVALQRGSSAAALGDEMDAVFEALAGQHSNASFGMDMSLNSPTTASDMMPAVSMSSVVDTLTPYVSEGAVKHHTDDANTPSSSPRKEGSMGDVSDGTNRGVLMTKKDFHSRFMVSEDPNDAADDVQLTQYLKRLGATHHEGLGFSVDIDVLTRRAMGMDIPHDALRTLVDDGSGEADMCELRRLIALARSASTDVASLRPTERLAIKCLRMVLGIRIKMDVHALATERLHEGNSGTGSSHVSPHLSPKTTHASLQSAYFGTQPSNLSAKSHKSGPSGSTVSPANSVSEESFEGDAGRTNLSFVFSSFVKTNQVTTSFLSPTASQAIFPRERLYTQRPSPPKKPPSSLEYFRRGLPEVTYAQPVHPSPSKRSPQVLDLTPIAGPVPDPPSPEAENLPSIDGTPRHCTEDSSALTARERVRELSTSQLCELAIRRAALASAGGSTVKSDGSVSTRAVSARHASRHPWSPRRAPTMRNTASFNIPSDPALAFPVFTSSKAQPPPPTGKGRVAKAARPLYRHAVHPFRPRGVRFELE